MRYFVYLSYDGTNYHGWQRQPNATSVQEQMEDVLQTVLRRKVNLVAAGRTDTGVHARLMVAHFDVEEPVDCQQLTFKFNCLLPPDIGVYTIVPVTDDAHARFSATSRTYHYHLYQRKDPFRRPYACRYYYELDFPRMNEAAARLMQHTDFGSFCKAGSDNKTNTCHLTHARWVEEDLQAWRFEITADRFLRNMVRAVVGTLLEVGKHRLTLEGLEDIVRAGNRSASGESMPACGLFLQDITYPDALFLSGKAPKIF